jgi:surface antigen
MMNSIKKKFCLCLFMMCLTIISGCASTTGQRNAQSSWGDCGLGALAGAGVGGVVGYLSNGAQGALIGAASGAVVGCVSGYLISEYLKPEEKRLYDANISKNMNNSPVNATGTNVWQSPDGLKKVSTTFDKSSSLTQAMTTVGPNVRLNQTIVSQLPANPICRVAARKFAVNGKEFEDKGVSCRDANGDWTEVTKKNAA